MSSCLDIDDLTPWTVVTVGIIIQICIRFIIDIKMQQKNQNMIKMPSYTPEYDRDDDVDHAKMDESKIDPFRYSFISNLSKQPNLCFIRIQLILKIWDCVSVITIFVLDVILFIRVIPLTTNWDNFQCLGLITLNSPNYKKIGAYFVFRISEFYYNINKAHRDYSIKTLSIWNIPHIIGLIIRFPIIFLYAIVGQFVYIEVTLVIAVFVYCFYELILCVKHKEKEQIKLKIVNWFFFVCPAIFCLFTGIVFGIAMITLYDGGNYLDCFVNAITERSFDNYFKNHIDSFEGIMRFVSWVF